MTAWSLVIGLVVGAGCCGIYLGMRLRAARCEAARARGQCETERLERARNESQLSRLAVLEQQDQRLREQLAALSGERARLEAIAERVPVLEQALQTANSALTNQRAANAALNARFEEQAEAHHAEVALLTDLKAGLDTQLKALTAEVLQSNQGAFLDLANQAFEKHRLAADAELDARRKAVADLVNPLQETLTSFRAQAEAMELTRAQAYGALSGELQSVAKTQNAVLTEASKLVQALRASPKTRGRWGEHTLQNVLELSGLSPYCDFVTEQSFDQWDGRLRPDVVIRLPGGRSLVVDAKTSTSGYLDAVEAVSEAEREQHLVLHASQTREHMKKLASKNYWDGLTVSPDFVVMFIPGDNFYSAAVERDPTLFEDAVAQRVIIATPSTLIALAKAVAFGWRQEKVADNARKVYDLGRDLYRRMTTMAEHIQNCGGALNKSVKCFNDFVGSLEQSVMPQVRRFNELEVEGTADAIAPLKPIEIETRLLRTDRDFAAHLVPSANSDGGPSATAA